jgi:hypothetical protein
VNLYSCRYRGRIVGKLRCTCSGQSISVYTCCQVVSGYCCRELPEVASDGPIALYLGGVTEQVYSPSHLDKPDSLVACRSCSMRS